jgi:hypothetical protein
MPNIKIVAHAVALAAVSLRQTNRNERNPVGITRGAGEMLGCLISRELGLSPRGQLQFERAYKVEFEKLVELASQ